jgi:hypothetical protein
MNFTTITMFALLATMCCPVGAQSPRETGTLSIAGQPASVRVFEYNGKSYVGLEDLARLTHGSLSFTGNQILLTLPDRVSEPPAPTKTGFSKQFLQAGIEQMSAIREWRITIVNSIQNNSPISEGWISRLRRKADEQLALAAAARKTDDDRSGYELLTGEFVNMQKLSDRFLDDRQQLHYIDPKSIDNNPLDQQILACARSLAAMAADNQFREEAACTELQ